MPRGCAAADGSLGLRVKCAPSLVNRESFKGRDAGNVQLRAAVIGFRVDSTIKGARRKWPCMESLGLLNWVFSPQNRATSWFIFRSSQGGNVSEVCRKEGSGTPGDTGGLSWVAYLTGEKEAFRQQKKISKSCLKKGGGLPRTGLRGVNAPAGEARHQI